MMDIAFNRTINGLLKGFKGEKTPAVLTELLTRDVEIVVPPERAVFDDLWPAIWGLAAVLERQLFGHVYIRCGLSSPLPAPAPLGPRCLFTSEYHPDALSIPIGLREVADSQEKLIGDARQGWIAIGETLPGTLSKPSAIECFLLAGYLGFSVLARLVGIEENRAEYVRPRLRVEHDPRLLQRRIAENPGYTCIGLGQLGQAFLALLFFLRGGSFAGQRLVLIDHESFEKENGRTQILLAEQNEILWLNQDKDTYMHELATRLGANASHRKEKIRWQWRKRDTDPGVALVGLDKLDVRRMVMAGGFERLVEAGVGTDLLNPRISWHSVPGEPSLGKVLFPDPVTPVRTAVSGAWVDELKATPGQCGWVQFEGISATAPCLGITVVAFAMCEAGYENGTTQGRATLWSPLLPILRSPMNAPTKATTAT
jgi:hypothetical protein